MIRRLLAALVIAWALGFVWFAATLPVPAPPAPSDAIVVLTGSEGRIERGLQLLDDGVAPELLVSGVDAKVRAPEFEAEFQVPDELMACCITLGFVARDTRGNALETVQWAQARGHRSLRLVTADWHMRRAALELARQLPPGIAVTRDAVRTQVSLATLLREYHKFLAAWAGQAVE